MTFSIEQDGAGRDVVAGDAPQPGGGTRREYVVIEHIMIDSAHGHAWLANDAMTKLSRLSPFQAEMLRWYLSEHGRAEPEIFSGDPV